MCQITLFLLLICLSVHSCQIDQRSTNRLDIQSRPQALLDISGEILAVSDVGYFGGDWQQGKVYWLDPQNLEILGIFKTPQRNPQKMEQDEHYVYILSSGIFESFPMIKSTTSAITRIPKTALVELKNLKQKSNQNPDQIEELLVLQNQKIQEISQSLMIYDLQSDQAFFVDMLLSSKWIYLSSGISPDVYRMNQSAFDLSEVKLQKIKSPQDGLSLISLVKYQDQLLAMNFNTDELSMIDQLDADQVDWAKCKIDLGQFPQEIEGAQGAVVSGDQLYYFMGLSGQLRGIDLKSIEMDQALCQSQIKFIDFDEPLGQIPNQIKIQDQQLYAVISGENKISQFDLRSKKKVKDYLLAKGSQPWHLLFFEAQSLFVSLWGLGKIAVFDLSSSGEGSLSVDSTRYQEKELKETPRLQMISNQMDTLLLSTDQRLMPQVRFQLTKAQLNQLKQHLQISVLQSNTQPFSQLSQLYALEISLEVNGQILKIDHAEHTGIYLDQAQGLILANPSQVIGTNTVDDLNVLGIDQFERFLANAQHFYVPISSITSKLGIEQLNDLDQMEVILTFSAPQVMNAQNQIFHLDQIWADLDPLDTLVQAYLLLY